jgi:hypothetical protein
MTGRANSSCGISEPLSLAFGVGVGARLDAHCGARSSAERGQTKDDGKCAEQDMHLVKIDGALENAFVLSLVKPIAQYAWLGASDEVTSRTFVWLDGKTVVYTNGANVKNVYQNFATGQLANTAGPNCLLITRGTAMPAGE